jgi:hypothetical protein
MDLRTLGDQFKSAEFDRIVALDVLEHHEKTTVGDSFPPWKPSLPDDSWP